MTQPPPPVNQSQNSPLFKIAKSVTKEINQKNWNNLAFYSSSLRNRLLSVILPTVLGTLTVSGLLGYRFLVWEKAQDKIKQQLVNEIALTQTTVSQKLTEAIKVIQLITQNNQVIDSLISSQQIVKKSNLNSLSIEELEKKYSNTKLLQPNQQLNDSLKKIGEISGLEEIFYTNHHGFNIAYSQTTSDFVQRDEVWWQKAQEEEQWLSSPQFDQSANTVGFELAQKIKDPKTGEFLGVIKALLPGTYFDLVADNLLYLGIKNSQIVQIITPQQQNAIQTVNSQGLSNDFQIVGGVQIAEIGNSLIKLDSNLEDLASQIADNYGLKNVNLQFYDRQQNIVMANFIVGNRYYTIIPMGIQDWLVVSSVDVGELQRAGSELIPILLPIAIFLMVTITLIIVLLANKLAAPLVDLAIAAEEAAEGNLEVVVHPQGTQETQTLAYSFNNLIAQVSKLLKQKQQEALQAQNLKDILVKLNELQDFQLIIETVVGEIKSILQVERVIYYDLQEQNEGVAIAESLTEGYASVLGQTINSQDWIGQYFQSNPDNRVLVIENIEKIDLSEAEKQQLINFQVQASLITQIRLQEQPYGLLIVDQCSDNRLWQQSEINFLEQVANQVSFTLERLNFLQEQQQAQLKEQQAKEQLQKRALELLQQVDPLSQGDLTIRAQVTEDEIGTIADSYNATIYSLQKLVNQVKTAVKEVEQTAGTNQTVIEQLAVEAIEQAQSIALTMQQIQQMTKSIQEVSDSASQAEQIVKEANETVLNGDRIMNQTVAQINSLQSTVNEAEKKVKLLGDSSQEISQVVNSISRFAAQTHLLALKASIEAARAGEQGKGFATIADEVRSLAAQSATASTDIENLVARIQLETNEVVSAMTQGTKQVTLGTELVQQTRQSLREVTRASQQISKLIADIAQLSQGQSKMSHQVRENISHVAVSAQTNSQSATQVSSKIEELLVVATKLQTDIDQFKT